MSENSERRARRRVLLLVLDGVGVGEAPDAARYGDQGCDSIGNTSRMLGGLTLPHLGRLGLGFLTSIPGTPPDPTVLGTYGKRAALSAGKDSMSGHWEMCGLVTPQDFPTYPQGFPAEVLEPFENAIGRGTLGNYAGSGTVILEELGQEHVKSGKPIVYTSADSVFQLAAHESVIPVDELYRMCERARRILVGEHGVGRVIARPFEGCAGAYRRTSGRKDFTLAPPGRSLLEVLADAGHQVVGVGKIEDLFSGVGVTQALHTPSNEAGLETTARLAREAPPGTLVFTNLNDFDTLWGHRNDIRGYAEGLRVFDAWLPELRACLRDGDLVIITADHGNDPTTPGTDHTREYVPVLAFVAGQTRGRSHGTSTGFMDIAATTLEHLGYEERLGGTSFHEAFGAV